jgi:uncharacterized protein (DUF58 family)
MSILGIAAMVLLGIVLALGIAWGAPVFALPLVVVGIAIFGFLNFRRRFGEGARLGRFRGEAKRASAGRDVEVTGRAREHSHTH